MSDEQFKRIAALNEVFTPAAPIEIKALFSGRVDQLDRCVQLVFQKGTHGIIYGDRGVGKTSIANILKIVFDASPVTPIKDSCHTEDTFDSLWTKLFKQVELPFETVEKQIGFTSEEVVKRDNVNIGDLLEGKEITITTIAKVLRTLKKPPVIIIDEFDRLGEVFNKALFADLIKYISDNLTEATLFIVGVGESLTDLIGEHPSIERNITQIYMPVMSEDELSGILTNGLGKLEMKMDKAVFSKIIDFSCGYPHYVHLLGYNCCYTSIMRAMPTVDNDAFSAAVKLSIKNSHESLKTCYQTATLAVKKNIYKEVLWAASLAHTDEYGSFQATDLEKPITKMLGKETRVNSFVFHLGKFCSEERGSILVALGEQNRRRYKFRNPPMKAYIKLNMYGEGFQF